MPPDPAGSVRLLLPSPGDRELEMPGWNGNEFLRRDGQRPLIRTFTPRRGDARSIELDIVVHDDGAASSWAADAAPGLPAAISGPGRGYRIDPAASDFVLVGGETAIPAIGQLLETIPDEIPTIVHLEVEDAAVQLALPNHPRAEITWHDLALGAERGATMLAALRESSIGPSTRVWCAGEAAAMYRVRKHLFEEREIKRSQATVRGYWKADRSRADT